MSKFRYFHVSDELPHTPDLGDVTKCLRKITPKDDIIMRIMCMTGQLHSNPEIREQLSCSKRRITRCRMEARALGFCWIDRKPTAPRGGLNPFLISNNFSSNAAQNGDNDLASSSSSSDDSSILSMNSSQMDTESCDSDSNPEVYHVCTTKRDLDPTRSRPDIDVRPIKRLWRRIGRRGRPRLSDYEFTTSSSSDDETDPESSRAGQELQSRQIPQQTAPAGIDLSRTTYRGRGRPRKTDIMEKSTSPK